MRIFTRELYNMLEADEDSMYNTHFIRKGNGRGVRRIDEPVQELKVAQKFALRILNSHARLLCHWRACGCIPRLDVRERVMQHAGREWAITTDIKDFYPTVTFDMLTNITRLQTYMDNEDIRCCLRTVNGQMVLPQGSPCSPMLANIAVIDLDNAIENMLQRWMGEIRQEGIGYMEFDIAPVGRDHRPHQEYRILFSRYMDDIIITMNAPERSYAIDVRNRLLELIEHHGFTPNKRKTKIKPYYQKQKWIGFSLNGRDALRDQPHVDKRYVNQVIDEGIEYVFRRENPFESDSWGGKLEYIRYNNLGRYNRVLRKIGLAMHIQGVELPDHWSTMTEIENVVRAHEIRVSGGEEEDHEVRPFFNNSGFYMYSSGSAYGGGVTAYSHTDTNAAS